MGPVLEERVERFGGEARTPSIDERFEILADEHRRVALSCLLERETAMSVDELIEAVITATQTDPTCAGDYRDRLQIQFHHEHLPKLHDVGIIEYQAESQVVLPQPCIDDIARFLEFADQLQTNYQ